MTTVGVDLGSSKTVMAVVGRGCVDIIRNDISERLTPSLVSFTDAERLVGDPALSSYKSNFKSTCRNMKCLLGSVYDASIVEAEQRHSYPVLKPSVEGLTGYEVQHRGETKVFSATAVTATLLNGLKEVAYRSLGRPVGEVVVAVPTWFTDRNCQAMLDAVAIAGLPCLRLMTEHAAIALDYGMFRLSQFHEEVPHRVMFLDVGYSGATASLVDFKKKGLSVVHASSDRTVGGRDMDLLITEKFAERMSAQLSVNILENKKTAMKVEEAAAKAKKVLSANSDAGINLESVYGEEDLNVVMTREEFTELCVDFKDRLAELIREAFRANAGAEIHSIELIGGCTRIPWVKELALEIAQQHVGEEATLSRTLNQDETIARGCALQAAMLSANFKVQDFSVNDIIVHPLAVKLDSASSGSISALEGSAIDASMDDAGSPIGTNAHQVLSKYGTYFPDVKWLSFPAVHDAKEFSLGLQVLYADAHKLPPSVNTLLCEYKLGIANEPTNPNAKVKVCLRTDLNCIVRVDGHLADSREIVRTVKRKVAPTTPKGDEGAEADDGPAGEASEAAPEMTEEVNEHCTEVIRTPLTVKVIRPPGWLSDDDLQELINIEKTLLHDDRTFAERKERLNDLEAYAYHTRAAVDSGPLGTFVHPQQKVEFLKKLDAAVNWVYDESATATQSSIVAKLTDLRIIGDVATDLMNQKALREAGVNEGLHLAQQYRNLASTKGDVYSHIDDQKKNKIIQDADQLEKWIREKVAHQSTLQLYDTPSLSPLELKNAVETFVGASKKVLMVKKPDPPVVPPPSPTADAKPADAADGTDQQNASPAAQQPDSDSH
eukprot:Lankesteria_metandrocarpae@DN3401_c0_g1_i1.p1